MKRLLVKLSIASEGATRKEKARAGICLNILSIKETLHRNRVRVKMGSGGS